MLVQFNLFLCFSPHESAGLFSASSQQQTANTLSPFCTTSPSIRSSPHSHLRAADPPALPSVSHKKTPVSFRRLLQTLLLIARLIYSRKVFFFSPPSHIYSVEAKTNCSHSSRSYRDSIHPLVGEFKLSSAESKEPAGFKIQPNLLLFFCRFFEKKRKRRACQTGCKIRLVDVRLHHVSVSLHLHLRLEGLQLQELRLCRSHHQGPGSISSAHVNAAGFNPKVSIHDTFLHAKRRNQKSTHWSSVHRGVFSSVTLKIHEEHVQMMIIILFKVKFFKIHKWKIISMIRLFVCCTER